MKLLTLKDENLRLNKHLKFSVFYFPVWFLVSWAMYETSIPYYEHLRDTYGAGLAYVLIHIFFAVTGILSFWKLRKRDIGKRLKILMAVIIIVLMLLLIPSAYSSHLNKMRLQEYVKDLESHGITVEYTDHFSYRVPPPTRRVNYTEFVDIAVNLNNSVTISAGVPYYFFLFFPRAIEMVCKVPYNGYCMSYRVNV